MFLWVSGDAAHGLFGAFADALAALYAEIMVNHRISLSVLGDRSYGTGLDQWAHVVVGADIFVYFYHN